MFYKKPYNPVREQVRECGRQPPPLYINVLYKKSLDENHDDDSYCQQCALVCFSCCHSIKHKLPHPFVLELRMTDEM